MPNRQIRQVFAEGHRRKFLVVVDESPEVEIALAYAARRARRTMGALAMIYIIEPGDFQHWLGVRDAYREEAVSKAKAVFRLQARKLKHWGYDELEPEELICEGSKAEQIAKVIEDDPDIGILVLGASTDPAGPGPLVSLLAGGKNAGGFPIPIAVVPGGLTLEEIDAMA